MFGQSVVLGNDLDMDDDRPHVQLWWMNQFGLKVLVM
jgi:hypothetical protein